MYPLLYMKQNHVLEKKNSVYLSDVFHETKLRGPSFTINRIEHIIHHSLI